MRAWLMRLVLALTGGLSASLVSAQPLILDPAFMAIVAPAECSQLGPAGTDCNLYDADIPPTGLVTLAHSSPSCRPGNPWNVCTDGVQVLEKMIERGGDRTTNVSFDYYAGGRAFDCTLSIAFTERDKKWGSDVWCKWEEETADRNWFSTSFPSGAHLVGVNGPTYVPILCSRQGLVLSYLPDRELLPDEVLNDGTPVELGFERDSPKEPPPYETSVEAMGDAGFKFEVVGDEVRAFIIMASNARRYVDVGVVLPSGSSINTQMPADGSTDAVRQFLQACP